METHKPPQTVHHAMYFTEMNPDEFVIKIANLEDFAWYALFWTLISFQSGFTWSRKLPEMSDKGLEQVWLMQKKINYD